MTKAVIDSKVTATTTSDGSGARHEGGTGDSPALQGSAQKKKRGAERQITKDDDEEDDSINVDPSSAFTKASSEELAQRRIIKARRPVGTVETAPLAVSNGTRDSDKTDGKSNDDTAKSSHPFQSVSLTNKDGNAGSTTTTAGFFGTTGIGGATGFKGAFSFSKNASMTGGGTLGFGSATSTATIAEKGGFQGFGSATAAGSSSFFGTTTNASFSFGSSSGKNDRPTFGFPSASTTGSANGNTSVGNANANPATQSSPAIMLPQNVQVTNGEEGEDLLLEVRVKSFQLIKEEDVKQDPSTTTVLKMSAVPPSSSTAPTTTSTTSAVQEGNQKQGKDDSAADDKKKDTAASTTPDEQNGATPLGTAQKQDTTPSHSTSASSRWRELGTGPLRVLRKTSLGTARVVQRREAAAGGQGTKLLVNLALRKETKLTQPSEKHVQVASVSAENNGEAVVFLFKVLKPHNASMLLDILQGEMDATNISGGSSTTPTTTNKKSS